MERSKRYRVSEVASATEYHIKGFVSHLHSHSSTIRGEIREPLLKDIESEDINDVDVVSIDGDNMEEENQEKKALLVHPRIPAVFRHSLPVLTVGTMYLLLLSRNLSTDPSVDLQVSFPDSKPLTLPSLFTFSLGNTVLEFYHAHIWALIFLVVVFSGLWPYVKLKLVLFAWSAPEWLATARKRERLLMLLDALSKFSLVDTFVLVIMLVAFRFHLDLVGISSIHVFVTPGYGFYGFLVATGASLLIGHVMLFFHRASTGRDYPAAGLRESLLQHEFTRTQRGRLY